MAETQGLNHLGLAVENLNTTTDFFTTVFGQHDQLARA